MKTKGNINDFFRLEYGMSYKEYKSIKEDKTEKKKNVIKTFAFLDKKAELNYYFKNETGMTYEEFSKIKFYPQSNTLKKVKKR